MTRDYADQTGIEIIPLEALPELEKIANTLDVTSAGAGCEAEPIEVIDDIQRPLANTMEAKQAVARRETILLVEDDNDRSKRRPIPGTSISLADSAIVVRVHKIINGRWERVAGEAHMCKPLKRAGIKESRLEAALKLLSNLDDWQNRSVVVAGTSYGTSTHFLKTLLAQGRDFAVEIRPSESVQFARGASNWKPNRARVSDLLANANWKDIEIIPPSGRSSVQYAVADLAEVGLPDAKIGRLFAAQTGGIRELHRGTIIGVTSVHDAPLDELLRCLGWARWIRPFVRRQERCSEKSSSLSNSNDEEKNCSLTLRHRSNITLAKLQDESPEGPELHSCGDGHREVLFDRRRVLNVVELFAGAGGMGLGFLMAEHRHRLFRLLFSGELHPIYVQTLKNNHANLVKRRSADLIDLVPDSVRAVDLENQDTLDMVVSKGRDSGGVDVLIGGPPCQGFSNANRNSWSRSNPQNRLVDVFVRYVERLNPHVFLMENVQGIVWTATDGRADAQPSVAAHILKRMKSAGYIVFPKLLDAVWYGVPQFRTRFFVLGIHRDSGYSTEDFGAWGPFPIPTHGPAASRPFTTVRDAIADLPAIGNGNGIDEMNYCEPVADAVNWFLALMRNDAPREKILDHVTSLHADYVIERYKRIPPGGNWQSIKEMMSNYTQLERTHSNIYRRLQWDEPSITIGHYRKSMLVHPDQHRGLSLREACRLQSFPDWFRFAGNEDGRAGGLMHKQQQLANAVCPLLSKKIAEFILEL